MTGPWRQTTRQTLQPQKRLPGWTARSAGPLPGPEELDAEKQAGATTYQQPAPLITPEAQAENAEDGKDEVENAKPENQNEIRHESSWGDSTPRTPSPRNDPIPRDTPSGKEVEKQ
eukprot:Hpha_TRINITY_DN3170_c0_g1::TRINITY_DN3170_c0_g1_i1::g.96517::m.96517